MTVIFQGLRKCHLILQKPRDVCSAGLLVRHCHGTRGRETHVHPRLHMATRIFGQLIGRVEHRAGTLCKSITDAFSQRGRGDGLERQEHVNCNLDGPSRQMLQFTCSSSSSSSPRGPWKMTVTGGIESLAARCQRATVHGLTVQSTFVAVVQTCSGRRRC